MKPITCKHCGAINQHHSFQCHTQRKPIKVKIVTNEWKLKQAEIKASKGKKSYVIPHVSEKQKERLKRYRNLRDVYMDEHKVCEANLTGCTVKSTDLHHKKSRIGDNLFKHFCALCRSCHNKIETGGEWVYEQGFKIKRTEQ